MAEDLCEPPSQMVAMTAGGMAYNTNSAEQRVPRNTECVIDLHHDPGNPSGLIATVANSPIVNVADSPLNNSYQGSILSWLLLCVWTVWTWICTTGMQTLRAAFFPTSKWYYYLFNCTPDEDGVAEQGRQEYLTQWETSLRSIARSWKDTQSITGSLLLVAALTVLQLDDVLSNRAICTLMAAAILLTLASILSSFVYLLSKERFISRWKASEGPDTSFWRCISLPLDFAIWSFVFFISTVFILIYQRMLPTQAYATIPSAQRAIASPQPVGEAIVAILSVITACKIYYGLKYFYRKN
ncbi:hypothetical protein CPC08DRAFT_709795 [Agrocybe pediades]|nr:hypothetical protein CPC08DRAFT_709795 [Agrocybe pediades]